MPHRIEVTLMPGQPSQIAFDLDVAQYSINRFSGDGPNCGRCRRSTGIRPWTSPILSSDHRWRPVRRGWPIANSYASPDGTVPAPGSYSMPRMATVPDYRGYERVMR